MWDFLPGERHVPFLECQMETWQSHVKGRPRSCTLEVTNRFGSSALVDRVPRELWTEVHNIVQEAETKTILKKKKCKKAKWLFEEALQIAEKEREK